MAHGEQIESRLSDADVSLDADEEDLDRSLRPGGCRVGLVGYGSRESWDHHREAGFVVAWGVGREEAADLGNGIA